MAPETILQELFSEPSGPLVGRRVLLTAGPTREAIDEVRYISNRSSGKMGYALAQALVAAGAEVCLVSGPVTLPLPDRLDRLMVESAEEMHQAVMTQLDAWSPHIFVACAAVGDYRMAAPIAGKMEKDRENLSLPLIRNADILAEVAALSPDSRPYCVGFAAETKEVASRGAAKRIRKGVDLMAANRVASDQGGFDRDENALSLSWAGGHLDLPMMPKTLLAQELAQIIAERYMETNTTDPDS
jgi:phosphopantothenoylcysteine decarboxylase/phosphopantothenate--cysteine ligase